MTDNLPFKVLDKPTIQKFLDSGLLSPIPKSEVVDYCKETGEQFTYKRSYKYFNLRLTITYASKDNFYQLNSKGSFHYLMNKGLHNANSPTLKEYLNYLKEFASIFDIALSKLIIKPCEFSMIIKPKYNIDEIIEYLFFVNREEFSFNPPHIKTSKISGKPTNNYRLKAYNKYQESYPFCEENALKCEYQLKRVRRLNTNGIYTLEDLLIKKNWYTIKDIYLENFNQIVLYDYTIVIPKGATSRQKNKVKNYSNPKYWRDLVRDCKSGKCGEKQYNKKVKDLNKISKKYGSNIKEELIYLLKKQWFNFLEMDTDAQL